MAGAEDEVSELAALLSAPIAVTYLHNDAMPADDPFYAGSLGLWGEMRPDRTHKLPLKNTELTNKRIQIK